MKTRIGLCPRVRGEGGGCGVVSQSAGAVLLVETARKTGLDQAISAALIPWRKPRAVHAPGQVLSDVALAVALVRERILGDGQHWRGNVKVRRVEVRVRATGAGFSAGIALQIITGVLKVVPSRWRTCHSCAVPVSVAMASAFMLYIDHLPLESGHPDPDLCASRRHGRRR